MKITETEFDFVHKDISDKDMAAFGLDPRATRFDDSWTLADIGVATGIFPSKGQARKNNFGGPIEEGFTAMVKTKRRLDITILNIGEWLNG